MPVTDLNSQIAALMALLQKSGQQGMQTGSPSLQSPILSQAASAMQNPTLSAAMPNMTPPSQSIQSLQGLNQAQPAAPPTLGMNTPMPLALPNADPQGQQNSNPVDPFAAALGQ